MKFILWFSDGNIHTFYSSPPAKGDEEVQRRRAFHRMIRLITKTFAGRWESAVIYANKGKELAAFHKGKRIR